MKIVKRDKTPARLKDFCDLAHQIAEQSYEQVWDALCASGNTIQEEWNGDDILSAASTCIAHFIGRWIMAMSWVAENDDTGRTSQEIFNDIFKGTAEIMALKVPLKKSKEPRHEFKRLY
jgi:hypothetical protein